MARLPRYFVKDQAQHIIQRGNNREPIFVGDEDYLFYHQCLMDAAEHYGCAIHAYVLMPNHVHLLATPETEQSLSKTLQSVGRRYVQYFNNSYDRTGTLWEGRYKATLIESKRYLLTCMRYIELNPVRAGIVDHPADYFCSSYRANAYGEEDQLIAEHPIYRRLGRNAEARLSAYRRLFRGRLAKADIDAIRDATNKAWVLGDDRFCMKMEALSGRRTLQKLPGRPRKEAD